MNMEKTPSLTQAENNHMARNSKRWDVSQSSQTSSQSPKLGVTQNQRTSDSKEHSKIDKDGVHDEQLDYTISPGQLYSTDSGRLFHAGKILIVLVGLPATSKTKLSVAITRYIRWLGVKSQAFHVSDYRKQFPNASSEKDTVPDDYYSVCPVTEEGRRVRNAILDDCLSDVERFFEEPTSQLAIYDALNILPEDRQAILTRFTKKKELEIKVLFIETIVTDPKLLARNIEIAIKSKDYENYDPQKARENFVNRININKQFYKGLSEDEELNFVKYINYGEKLIVNNNNNYGYLVNKILFFLMNLKEKKGKVYLSRCGTSDQDKYIDDEYLNEEGLRYSEKLTSVVLKRLEFVRSQRNKSIKDAEPQTDTTSLNVLAKPVIETNAILRKSQTKGKSQYRQVSIHDGADEDSFLVWTAPRKRTHDTSKYFQKLGIPVRQRNQLKQLHPGVVADMDLDEIAKDYPHEYQEFLEDPYHYRFPRAESYHDLAVRIESLLLEIERMCGDILIIAHESTLRILYGYLMACTSCDIPNIEFPRNEIIEIVFGHYENTATRIPINY